MGNIRPATEEDFQTILALNDAVVELTSPLDLERLTRLDELSAYHRVYTEGDRVLAFLLVFREGSAYDSSNYGWFAERLPNFLYIDRVVVSATSRGSGAGRKLYEDLIAFARESAVEDIVCEYYSVPLNDVSKGFHAAMGFEEMGTGWLSEAKCVSYQRRHTPLG